MIACLYYFMAGLVLSLAFAVPGFAQIGFIEHPVAQYYNNPWSVFGIDMDDDGDTDVVAAGRFGNSITWWENLGNLTFQQHDISNNSYYAVVVYAIDMDNDDDIDILCASQTNGVELWENQGDQSFTRHIIGDWPYASFLTVADVDSDLDPDVLVCCCEGGINRMGWIENEGNLSFTDHIVMPNWDHANSVCAADLDSDQDMDLIGTASQAGEIAWFENDGNQNFTQHIILSTGARPSCAYADDIDSDGDIDVLATVCAINQVLLFENNGSQGFNQYTIAYGFSRPHSVRTADFDNDGDVDVLGAAINSDKIAWWENTGGNPIEWWEHTISDNFDGATGIDAKDFDLDGDIDVLGAAQFGNQITLWENIGATGIDENSNSAPDNFLMLDNCPNPFNASTNISFSVPQSGEVKIVIYDLLGRLVDVPLSEFKEAGNHSVTWSADKYPSGIYFYRLATTDGSYTRRMTLSK
ncbi:MAG: T9SS type A sorting domain-containing protein [Candidatus Zixiibacteriota bacterium]|nr:MAG: T9SS type A sorting domain-containing protein [candidate division Zixibacteria bacterium]